MEKVKLPDEDARLAALAACAVMHTPRETRFDNLVFTAAQLLRTPLAILSLVSADRVWIKASVGPIAKEWSRQASFCHYVIQSNEVTIVEDASTHPQFAALACVAGDAAIRFVAGAPLRGPGKHHIGALCAFDRSPRTLSETQRRQLIQLAIEASELLCLRVPNLDLDMAG